MEAVWEGAAPFWSAFEMLNRTRGRDMGDPLPIALADMLAYAGVFGWTDPTDLEELLDVLADLDTTYLDFVATQRSKYTAPSGRPPKGAR